MPAGCQHSLSPLFHYAFTAWIMAPMRTTPAFRVLGTLEADRDGSPMPLPSRRQRAVLAALLARAGKPVPADELVEAAWSEQLPDNPKAALQTVVSRLRTALGAEAISGDISGYRLNVTADDVDALLFEALRERAARAPDAAAAGLLDAALALWRGPAYAEFTDRDFASAEAARLNELRAAAIEDYADICLRTGHATDAIARLEALQASEPWRERCVELLMRALGGSGRAVEALQAYYQHRRSLTAELGLEPSPGLQVLQARILRNELPTLPRPVAHPPRWFAVSTPLVGRDSDMAALAKEAGSSRLVTVTGVGGVGKTRLVAESLGELAAQLQAPTAVVELGGVQPGSVDSAVAAALGVDVRAGTPRTAVSEYLGASIQLLVIDNCEHVLTDARELIKAVLRACPRVRIIATSRHRLGLPDEQVLPLDPLPTEAADAPTEQLRDSAPVRLFIDRLRRLRPSFPLTTQTVQLSAAVCRRLDGVPLAIELAAGQAAAIGLTPVLDRLGDLDVLADAEGGMRAVLDRSWSLLTSGEQQLLARLSVFAADFDLDAAEQVGGPAAALRLARLVEASLLQITHQQGQAKYQVLAIVRVYAAEQLRADDDALAAAHVAHARWIRDLSVAAAADIRAGGAGDLLRRLLAYRADVLAAAHAALEAGELELAGSITAALGWCSHWVLDGELQKLARHVAGDPRLSATPVAALARASGALYAAQLGDLNEAYRLGTQALAIASTPDEECMALHALGVACLYRGEHAESMRHWQKLIDLPGVPTPQWVDSHASIALLACYHSDQLTARQYAELALANAQAAGPAGAFATYAMGEVKLLDDPAAAVEILELAVAQAEVGRTAQIAEVARIALVSALVRLGRHDQALLAFPELLHQLRRRGGWPQLWTSLRILAELLEALGRPRDAALLLASASRDPAAPQISGDDIPRYQRLRQRIIDQIGTDAYQRLADQAALLPRAQVPDQALAVLSALTRQPMTTASPGSTPVSIYMGIAAGSEVS
jgi:predicted ATPase/DNA-binding SARP family transcriptional activator